MINKMFAMLKKPVLWQRSSEPFWDDEHISKQMLKAHLDPGMEAASRKQEDIERSVQWLSTVIPADSKILDLGCGPGLYTKRLSEMDYEVTGIDFSKRSIAYAKSQDQKTEYLYQNYLELDYEAMFDAVTLIYCDYAALIPSERKILLNKVNNALKPGGVFIFDVFSEKKFESRKEKKSWALSENGGFWSSQPHVCLEATYLYEDGTAAVSQNIIITEDMMHEYLIWDTVYTVQRLKDEIGSAGFKVKEIYDDVSGRLYTGEADTLCIVAKKQI